MLDECTNSSASGSDGSITSIIGFRGGIAARCRRRARARARHQVLSSPRFKQVVFVSFGGVPREHLVAAFCPRVEKWSPETARGRRRLCGSGSGAGQRSQQSSKVIQQAYVQSSNSAGRPHWLLACGHRLPHTFMHPGRSTPDG